MFQLMFRRDDRATHNPKRRQSPRWDLRQLQETPCYRSLVYLRGVSHYDKTTRHLTASQLW